jgi:hypothetical protein
LSVVDSTAARANLPTDTAKAAVAKYWMDGATRANDSPEYHAASAAPKKKGYSLRRVSSSSFTHSEQWDFLKDATNAFDFSCSIRIKLKGSTSKVTIALQPTSNWCPGFLMKAFFYPASNRLVSS